MKMKTETNSDYEYLCAIDEMSLEFISAGLFDGSVVQKSVSHAHDVYEILYHLAGQGNIKTSNKLQAVRAYDAIVIPPNVFHTESSDTYLRKKLIWMRFKCKNTKSIDRAIRIRDIRGIVRHDVEMLFNEYSSIGDKKIIDMRFKLIFNQIKRLTENPILSDEPAAFLVSYLKDNYMHDILFSDLAKHMGISPSYLSSLFTHANDMSPGKYLLNLRITAAKEIIQMKNLSINEVAMECGFNDPLYFSRVFKREIGMTPTEFKELTQRTHIDHIKHDDTSGDPISNSCI